MTNYSLFHTFDGDMPRQFQEVRVFGHTVWTAGGAAMTWGEEARREYPGEAAARAAYAARCRAVLADGYALVRSTAIDPAVFDFPLLQTLLQDGARKAFGAVRAAYPRRQLNAFALLTDEGAMSIAPMVNCREALAVSDYADEMQWNPAEWAFDEGGAYFDSAYRLLLQAHRDLPFDVDFASFRSGMFEACVAALEQLDRERLFGTGAQRDDTVLLFDVSGGEPVPGALARLNPPAVVARFDAWVASWAD
ncbi:MAG: DUF4303 domain-containing protein [Janthinobacterium sp.]|jgi:hypothetical protein